MPIQILPQGRNETVAGCTDGDLFGQGRKNRDAPRAPPPSPNYRKSSQDGLGRQLGSFSVLRKGGNCAESPPPATPALFSPPSRRPSPLSTQPTGSAPQQEAEVASSHGDNEAEEEETLRRNHGNLLAGVGGFSVPSATANPRASTLQLAKQSTCCLMLSQNRFFAFSRSHGPLASEVSPILYPLILLNLFFPLPVEVELI